MKVGKTLYVHTRAAWRSWLAKNHATAPEIWLIFYKKNSGKPRLDYSVSVEEALCYGWIDSIVKTWTKTAYVQRFSPRKTTSVWSAMNIERVRRLLKKGAMRKAGMLAASPVLHKLHIKGKVVEGKAPDVPPDILRALKRDPVIWRNYSKFPDSYKRIRVGWIDGSRNSSEVFRKRLNYFLMMTKKNKRFGMVQ